MDANFTALLVSYPDSEHVEFREQRWRNEENPECCNALLFTVRHEKPMINTKLIVSVVDDDQSVRESLLDLLKVFGYEVRAFASAEEFLASPVLAQTECLILDIAMPGMNGPALQRELERRRLAVPTIFITANRDETVRSRMLESGAVECLFKPFSDTALWEALGKIENSK